MPGWARPWLPSQPGAESLRRQCLAEQVALPFVAPEITQKIPLRRGFNTRGGHFQAERMAFGHRQEQARSDHAALAMRPSDERLAACDCACSQHDPWLVM